MKRFILTACCVAFAALASAPAGRAQTGTVAAGPDPTAVTDAESDKAARHELEVARHYFRNKKAYYASFKRCEELAAGYPEFGKIDEVLYIAGMSSLYLSEGKGKQRPPASAPDKSAELSPQGLRATAREYLTRLVSDHPKSKFRKDAEEALAQLGGAASQPAAEKPRQPQQR